MGFEPIWKLIYEKVNHGEWSADDPRAIGLQGPSGGITAEITSDNGYMKIGKHLTVTIQRCFKIF